MREIKFKCPVIEADMFYGFIGWEDARLNTGEYSGDCDTVVSMGYDFSDFKDGSYHGILPPIQYTGLKDKNGVEIYEGDIVSHNDTLIGGRFTPKCEVIWWDDRTLATPGWGLWVINGGYIPLFLGELEVIGNIYENPELLGGE